MTGAFSPGKLSPANSAAALDDNGEITVNDIPRNFGSGRRQKWTVVADGAVGLIDDSDEDEDSEDSGAPRAWGVYMSHTSQLTRH